jgi:hypothetical protein
MLMVKKMRQSNNEEENEKEGTLRVKLTVEITQSLLCSLENTVVPYPTNPQHKQIYIQTEGLSLY